MGMQEGKEKEMQLQQRKKKKTMDTLGNTQTRSLLRLVFPILLLSLCLHFQWIDASTPVAPSQVGVLLELKKSLEGKKTSPLSSWNALNNCSTWLGLTCDENGLVIEINLYSEASILPPTNYKIPGFDPPPFTLGSVQLSGFIPESIGNLTTLKKLSISGNRLSRGIPSSIGDLVNLEILDLSDNNLRGIIPFSITNLSKLRLLFLSFNSLMEDIPEHIGILSNLLSLDLSENYLNSSLPESLSSLTNLRALALGSNDFPPSLIPSWITNMTYLQYLDFRAANVNGTVPVLDKLLNLTYIDLSFNNLSGSITNQFSKLVSLNILILSTNSFDGFIPTTLGNLPLDSIDLSRNKFSGDIPLTFGNIGKNLLNLDLSGNNLNGTIPDTISNLTSLSMLNLGSNQLIGTIPGGITKLSALVDFFVNENSLTGEISLEIGNATSLVNLVLSNNQLSGLLPSNISLLTNLNNLLVDHNNFSGQIPPEFGNLQSLQVLDASQNNFLGIIPTSYGELKNLRNLRLFQNSLQGPIPDLSNLTQLVELDLSLNRLNGSVPNNLSLSLIKLNLASNSLSGILPSDFFKRLQSLTTLDLSLNQLTGAPSFKNISNSLSFIALSPGQSAPPVIYVGNFSILIFGGDCSVFNTLCIRSFSDYVNKESPCATNCNGLEEMNPVLYYKSESCSCSPPLIVEIQLYAPLFYAFNERESSNVKTYFAGITNLPEIQVKVKNASVIVNNQVTFSVFLLFFTNNTNPWATKDSFEVLFSLYNRQGERDVPRIGPYRVVNYLRTDKGKSVETESKNNNNKLIIILIICIIVLALIVVVAIALLCLLICGKNKKPGRLEESVIGGMARAVSLEEVLQATQNFSQDLMLGKGRFSTVYKGKSKSGQIWAVKRIMMNSRKSKTDFENEVKLISHMDHRNLVKCLGYCNEQDERILIYEFMARGTLRNALNPRYAGVTEPVLTFDERLKIACGFASGLDYLHHGTSPPVVHNDIRSENILLDEHLRAKVVDFCPLGKDSSEKNSDLDAAVPEGNPGYMDPDHGETYILTEKSNVYSFGIVLMELLTGKAPLIRKSTVQTISPDSEDRKSKISIAEWAVPLIEGGQTAVIMDPLLNGNYDSTAAESLAQTALDCVKREGSQRPDMSIVAARLNKIQEDMRKRNEPRPQRTASHIVDVPIPYNSNGHEGSKFFTPTIDLER